MLHGELEIPVEGIDEAFVTGEGLKGDGVNEICGVGGHKHMHVAVQLFQHTGKIRDFIGGNAAGNAKKNSFSFQHNKAPFS